MLKENIEAGSSKFLKFEEIIENKRELFLLSFYVSLGLVILGITLCNFPRLERFFFKNQIWFYIFTFLPICLSVLSFVVLILTGTFFFLYDEYKIMRSQGVLIYKIAMRIVLYFFVIIVLIGLAIYSGDLSWPKRSNHG